MCRSIKTLRTGATPASDEEITAAALQYVRKVSGYRKPSTANEAAFEKAVADVARVSRQLLEAVTATHPEARRASGRRRVSATRMPWRRPPPPRRPARRCRR